MLNGEWDNIYTGTIDRTGGRWGSLTDVPVTFGNSQNSQIVFNSANSCLTIGLDTTKRTLLICEKGDETTAFGYASPIDPQIVIHSADSSVAAEYIALAHDGTGAILASGIGPIKFSGGGTQLGSFSIDGLLVQSGSLVMESGGFIALKTDSPLNLGINLGNYLSQIIYNSTNDSLTIGVNTTSRTLLVCDKGDETTDFNFAVRSDPSIIVHAADATATNSYCEVNSTGMGISDNGIAHGFTIVGSTVGGLLATLANTGGFFLIGATEQTIGVKLSGYTNVSDTTKSAAANGAVYIEGHGSGASGSSMSANANICVIADHGAAKFIFDHEGDAHADVSWTTFDDFDDLALIDDLERGITQGFGEMLVYNREAVEKAGIAHFDETPGRAMVNFTRLAMLLCGAMKQTNDRISRLEQRLLEG